MEEKYGMYCTKVDKSNSDVMCDSSQVVQWRPICKISDNNFDAIVDSNINRIRISVVSSLLNMYKFDAAYVFFFFDYINKLPYVCMVGSDVSIESVVPTLHSVVSTWQVVNNTVMYAPHCVYGYRGRRKRPRRIVPI